MALQGYYVNICFLKAWLCTFYRYDQFDKLTIDNFQFQGLSKDNIFITLFFDNNRSIILFISESTVEKMSKRLRKISLRKKDSKGSIGDEVTKCNGLKRSKSASFLGISSHIPLELFIILGMREIEANYSTYFQVKQRRPSIAFHQTSPLV